MTKLRTMAVTLSGLVFLAGCQGASEICDPAKTKASLTGQALSGPDGAAQPAPGVYAILIDRDGKRQVSRTDGQGGFRFDEVTPGDMTLVLNDLAGQGIIRRMVVVGGGENSLGDFALAPLEKQPEALDFQNIGFEEKLTESTGDHLEALFSADTAFAVALSRLPGEYVYDLVRTDLATGAEEVLAQDQYVAGPNSSLGRWLILQDDRFVIYEGARPIEGKPDLQGYTFVAYDLADRLERAIPRKSGSGFYTVDDEVGTFIYWGAWTVQAGTVYYLQQVGNEKELSSDPWNPFGCTICGRKMEFCRFELATGERACVPTTGVDDHLSFDNVHFTQDAVFYQVGANSDSPNMPNQYSDVPVWRIRFADLVREPIVPDPVSAYAAAHDGARLFTVRTGEVGVVELATGQRRTLLAQDGVVFNSPTPSPDDRALAIKSGTSYEILDSTSGMSLASFSGTTSFKGIDIPSFAMNSWTADSQQLLFTRYLFEDEYETLFGERKAVILILHLPVDGSAITIEDLPTDQNPLYRDVETPTASPDGTVLALTRRVAETGFSQLFVRPADGQDWVQASFISAQHGPPVWSPDGQWLLYVTRDPVSGYNQYFRVAPDNFLDPDRSLAR